MCVERQPLKEKHVSSFRLWASHLWRWITGSETVVIHACNGMVLKRRLDHGGEDHLRSVAARILDELCDKATAIYVVSRTPFQIRLRFYHLTEQFASSFASHVMRCGENHPLEGLERSLKFRAATGPLTEPMIVSFYVSVPDVAWMFA